MGLPRLYLQGVTRAICPETISGVTSPVDMGDSCAGGYTGSMNSSTIARVPFSQAASPELEIEQYLHRHIPMSAAMGIRVLLATERRVELAAPLAPNINHQSTVFGGSASAVATLSAWTLVHVGLRYANVEATTVIQRNVMSYEEPIHGDFKAVCTLVDEPAWQRFIKTIERRGRARITMNAHLLFEDRQAASFEGDFVALQS
jgi:thioesterase domain-containing protein